MKTPRPVIITLLFACGCGSPKDGETAGDTTGAASTADGSSTGSPTTAPTTTSDGMSGSATSDGATGTTDDPTGDATTGEPACDPGPFITRDVAFEQVRQDLLMQPAQAQPFTRYVSLVHLHNAGLCEPDIAPARRAAAKLLNALSSEPSIVTPKAIDDAGLLLRIDLRDYGWQDPVVAGDMQMFADTWEMVARSNPHALEFAGDVPADLQKASGTGLWLLPADALAVFAALPPLYYDALRLPTQLDDLAAQLGIDIDAQIADERTMDLDTVARASMRVSGSSDFNRVIERHELPNAASRALWRTHDFAAQSGQQNIFTHPLDFDTDITEVMFSLPNDLHGYMIVDAAGNRLDEMPVNIERSPLFPDQIVRPGLACMACHTQGVIKARDDLRFELDEGMLAGQFDADTEEQIRNLHPPREDMDAIMEADIANYAAASELAGVPVADEEPVSATWVRFDAPVDLARAAAELWLPVAELQEKFGVLPVDLMPLKDGTVTRAVFSANFAESACALGVAACP